jgi:hypothetical protein
MRSEVKLKTSISFKQNCVMHEVMDRDAILVIKSERAFSKVVASHIFTTRD